MKLDGRGFPAAELPAVVGLLDQIAADEGTGGPLLAGDARLSAPPDDVVADDVVPIGVDVAVADAGRLAQNDPDAAGVGDGAVLDDPVLSHPRADGARLQLQTGRRPVRRRVQEMEAIDGDVFQTGDFGHEQALANVDFGQLRIGIGLAEIRSDDGRILIHPAMPGALGLRHFLHRLSLVEGLAVEIDVPAMMPLAVIEPASGNVQGVRVVCAEEGIRQLDSPNAAGFLYPGGDPLGAFDEDFFPGRRPVGDACTIIGAAAAGFDPFAIRSGVNEDGISGLRNGCGLIDGQIRPRGAARSRIVAHLRDMHLTRGNAAGARQKTQECRQYQRWSFHANAPSSTQGLGPAPTR